MSDLDRAVRELVEHNPGQATFEEYICLAQTIRRRAPCNLLVFGSGRDSELWMTTNAGGVTAFLEDIGDWIETLRQQAPGAVIHRVTYGTKRFQWPWLLRRPDRLLMRDLPDEVRNTAWDIIFIDGPAGNKWSHPGRMKSIYTASFLAQRSVDVDVFVHDCHRNVERIYSERFIGPRHLVEQVGTLRHYRIVAPATQSEA